MKRWAKLILFILVCSVFQLSILATIIVMPDKVGANMLIPVEATNVEMTDAQINYSIEKPKSINQDDSNVDLYKGAAIVDADYELTNVGEEVTHVTLAFPVNDFDEILKATVGGEDYTPLNIEVDRLTSIQNEGLNLHGEYNVSQEQIINRILSSKNDDTSNYITGTWQRVYIVEFDIDAGESKHFTLEYKELSGVSRRGNNAVTSVLWEPEFYYYLNYMAYFQNFKTMTFTLHLPSTFEIGVTSYESYTELAPNVYQIAIEGMPESNLIFTVHNPENIPTDTGIVEMMSLVVKLLIVSAIIIGVLLAFLLFNAFVAPIIKKRMEEKKIEKLKNRIISEEVDEDASDELDTGEVMEHDTDLDVGQEDFEETQSYEEEETFEQEETQVLTENCY